MRRTPLRAVIAALVCVGASTSPLRAEMVLSQVVVDLQPDAPMRDDIEVWNDGDDRMYVLVEPSEILNAGTPAEQRISAADSEASGLLVAPRRLVLEPGERRLVRVALVGERPQAERVFRLAIRPVGGAVTAATSALKVFVGYDALVLIRPAAVVGDVVGRKDGRTLTIRNNSNISQELFDGKQCDAAGLDCHSLPSKRLYSGAVWDQPLASERRVSYRCANGSKVRTVEF